MALYEWMIVGMVACLVGGLGVLVMRSVDADGLKKVDDAAGKHFDPSGYPRLVRMKNLSLALLFGAVLFLGACIATRVSAPMTSAVVAVASAPTDTPAPVVTFAMGRTTPLPTREHVTPAPIVTPRPTPTPEPTPEPTPIPPTVYTGTGDDVIRVDMSEQFFIHVTGNAASRYFGVTGYDADGEITELFVNTTHPYDGVGWDVSTSTTALQIEATGDWTVELYGVDFLPEMQNEYSGTGDAFVFVLSKDTQIAHIVGNEADAYFGVNSWYIKNGQLTYDMLVNTTDPYDGKKLMKNSPLVIEVKAEGPWSITLE